MLVITNVGEYSMRDLTTWLLVVDALVAAAMVAYRGGLRPLVPEWIRSQPARPDQNRSR